MRALQVLIIMTSLLLSSCLLTPVTTEPETVVGQLKVGFDIDDTILFSRDNFQKAPKDSTNSDHIDFGWVNTHDSLYSVTIKPVADLIGFLRAQGHEIYFITARPGVNGETLARFLSSELGFTVEKEKNLFFATKKKDPKTGKRFTSKHEVITKLGIHIFYGDADNDMVAASIAGIRGVRVVRDPRSVDAYSRNYFGDTKSNFKPGAPFDQERYEQFLGKGVGPYGETIFPLYPAEVTDSE